MTTKQSKPFPRNTQITATDDLGRDFTGKTIHRYENDSYLVRLDTGKEIRIPGEYLKRTA